MSSVINSQWLLDDVVKWMTHPGYCQEADTVTGYEAAVIPKGTSLIGHIAIGGAGSWALLEAGDIVTPGTTEVAVVTSVRKPTEDIEAAGSIDDQSLLVRGPAIVHRDRLNYNGHASPADVDAALEAAGIIVRDETGEEFTLES